jgi:error-prone DNA polymerase
MNPVERLRADYSGTGLSVGPHPMKLIRSQLPQIWRASDLAAERNGTLVKIAGQVICRQRPGTAKGFVFVSLEDETGVSNAIVTPQLFERCRLLITEEPFLMIEGVMQNVDNVIHVKARYVEALQFKELALPTSHDFR